MISGRPTQFASKTGVGTTGPFLCSNGAQLPACRVQGDVALGRFDRCERSAVGTQTLRHQKKKVENRVRRGRGWS